MPIYPLLRSSFSHSKLFIKRSSCLLAQDLRAIITARIKNNRKTQEQGTTSPGEWENCLAITASIMYHLPVEQFRDYAHLRVAAMLLRDAKGNTITEVDWQQIRGLLLNAWQSFAAAIAKSAHGQVAGQACRLFPEKKCTLSIFTPGDGRANL